MPKEMNGMAGAGVRDHAIGESRQLGESRYEIFNAEWGIKAKPMRIMQLW